MQVERGGQMRKPRLSSTTASHIWSEVTSGASEFVQLLLLRDHPPLERGDVHTMPFTFHGFRHTAITRSAVAGRSQLFLLTGEPTAKNTQAR